MLPSPPAPASPIRRKGLVLPREHLRVEQALAELPVERPRVRLGVHGVPLHLQLRVQGLLHVHVRGLRLRLRTN